MSPTKRRAGGDWLISHVQGEVGALHRASAEALNEEAPGRSVTFVAGEGSALVLGSHQDEAVLDPAAAAAAGIAITRRRSGGSAVLVGAGRVLWVDFRIGADDPLWDDDVGRAAWWVGELWAAAVAAVTARGVDVWRGGMRRTAWSPVVCFAGLAPGEVTADGRKVVGVCQRRTPRAALFQTAAVLEWDAEEYVQLVRSAPGPTADLAGAAYGLGDSTRLESALMDGLMT